MEFETNTNQIILIADKSKIKEVIENLVSNAIKYSHFEKIIKIITRKTDSTIEIEVIDQGQGFSKEDLSKIYGKYQKLSAKPTNNETSTGLGLYIVNKIITHHNGKITLDSELGKGSKFKIILPIQNTDSAPLDFNNDVNELINAQQNIHLN